MFKFAHIELLYLLALLPVLIAVFVFAFLQKKRNIKKFTSEELREVLIPDYSPGRSKLKFILTILAFIFMVIAASGPRVGSKLKEVKKTGREIIVALDVSNSMLAEDISPNRLEMAKLSLNRLLNNLADDKLGLIVFAGDAYTQIPVTNDIGAARLFLNSVSTDIVSKQGTSIAAAIDLAARSFSPETTEDENQAGAKARAIIIITDGENHDENAIQSAKNATEKGIQIYTIGLGDPKGVPIPLSPGSNNYKRDKDGNVVVSKLDEEGLKKIASIGNGFYIRGGKAGTGLNQLINKLNELDAKEYSAKVFSEYEERYQYFLALGLILLLIEFITMERRNKWLGKIKLFG